MPLIVTVRYPKKQRGGDPTEEEIDTLIENIQFA